LHSLSLGNGQFMKTIRCRHPKEGLTVVKLFAKPELGMDVSGAVRIVKEYHQALMKFPGVLSYPLTVETDRAVYLARQFLYSSLYDRISTRPFLETTEKIWITYQLMSSLRDTHALNLCHGDIKCENVLISSWNWAYLCDFAPYKPTWLPEDNPANFSYFFDTSARRTCYVAPERFVTGSTGDLSDYVRRANGRSSLRPAMDIFGLGCVIAELFLEGKSIFTLAQLLQYKGGEYDPGPELAKIRHEPVRALIQRMIHLDPKQRPSAAQCLRDGAEVIFPAVYGEFLYPYMAGGVDGPSQTSNSPATLPTVILCCSDARIDRIYHDWDTLCTTLDLPLPSLPPSPKTSESTPTSPPPARLPHPAALILISLVTACLRNTAYPTSKRHGLELLLWLAAGASDDHILNRILPHVLSLVSDDSAAVRQAAIHILTQLLTMVRSLAPQDADLFPDYLLPSLRGLLNDPEPMVRMALASSMAALAETAVHFLEQKAVMGPNASHQISQSDTSSSPIEPGARGNSGSVSARGKKPLWLLRLQFQGLITHLLTDTHPGVRRALLVDMTRLAIFFGRTMANDFLLSHVITFLNDRDWHLRSAFFEAVVGIAAVVGPRSLELYILPLMQQSLADANEGVVEKVLHCFTALTETGLFGQLALWDLFQQVLPMLYHPNPGIRYGTVALVAAVAAQLPEIDRWCLVVPALEPFLQVDTLDITCGTLLAGLKPPITRRLFQEILAKPLPPELSTPGRPSHSHSGAGGDRPGGGYSVELRDLGLTPHTVFLTPWDAERPVLPATGPGRNITPAGVTVDHFRTIPITKSMSACVSPAFPSVGGRPIERIASEGALQGYSPTTTTTTTSCSTPSSRISSVLTAQTDIRRTISKVSALAPVVNTHPASIARTRSPVKSPIDLPAVVGIPPTMSDAPRSVSRLTSKASPPIEVTSPTSALHWLIHYDAGQTVKILLRKKALEIFPRPLPELGPATNPATLTHFRRLTQEAIPSLQSWRPEGTLVAFFKDHTAAINAISLSTDQALFATASDDMTVKVWDCLRLEKHVLHRARSSYDLGARVQSLTFLQGTYSLAATGDDGSIHLLRIDSHAVDTRNKYGTCQLVRRSQLSVTTTNGGAGNGGLGEYAIQIAHVQAENQSYLLVATTASRLVALDIHTLDELWSVHNPLRFGLVTAFVTDPRRTWVLVGTAKGVLTLWDLRFRIAVKSWQHPRRSRIHQLSMYLAPASHGKWVLVATGRNEVSVWDVESESCHEVFC
ncbi:armadillo-type protein, partial [Dimargaris cristalligena]